jgi:hypothetical protein
MNIRITRHAKEQASKRFPKDNNSKENLKEFVKNNWENRGKMKPEGFGLYGYTEKKLTKKEWYVWNDDLTKLFLVRKEREMNPCTPSGYETVYLVITIMSRTFSKDFICS